VNELVVVGGGVLGTAHALAACDLGWRVTHLERDAGPRGASLRNFGLVWVSGRARGRELDMALDARERWEAIAARHPGLGFRADGSLTVATTAEEEAVLEAVAQGLDAAARGVRVVGPDEARGINPALGKVRAALHCAKDAVVEPRRVLSALRDLCEASGRYHWSPGREVKEAHAHAVVDVLGQRYEGDLVVLCTGAAHGGVAAPTLAALASVASPGAAPVRRVRLQMMETDRFDRVLATSVADGDSLRYYPAYDVPAREDLQPQARVAAEWGAQLLLVQRADGSLTVGDTHAYDEPFPFDLDEAPYRHLLEVAGSLVEGPLPPVVRRWAGVYSQVTDPSALYLRAEVAPGVQLVTGPGGRGMTLAPAIAAETFA
jgi:FAD dependent oxidoreductase TIGR03364